MTKKLTLKVGKKKTIKIKNAGKSTAKWKVVKGKKRIKLTAKKKSAIIKAKKAGTAKICAKINKKKLYCTIQIKKADKKITVISGPQDPDVTGGDGLTRNTTEQIALSKSSVNLTKGLTREKVLKKQPSQQFNTAFADFSVEMLKRLKKNDTTGKMLISPDSILTALAMLENGASGETLAQMQNVMGKNMELAEYQSYLSTLNQELTSEKGMIYQIADSIWMKQESGCELKPSFLQANTNYHDAEIYQAPFDDSTVKDINAWCSNHTDGMIPSILDRLDGEERFILLNAVLFEGKWAEQYEDVQVTKENFTTGEGSAQKASMLNGKEHRYLTLNGGSGFMKSYYNSRFAFVGLLPKEGQSLEEYIDGLDGSEFIKACLNPQYETVETKLPEFSYDYSQSLKKTLAEMGMEKIFSPESAEFQNMITEDSLPVYADDVFHKTHIELDRNGTKAAAVTEIVMKANSAAPMEKIKQVYLNRPFVYAIVDTKTGVPLFLGAIEQLPQ